MSKNETVYVFSCSHEMGELIKSLSEHVEGGNETLLQKSIILMGVVMRAKKLGHQLAIVDKENKILEHIEVV